jgi:hypothetical protein
VGVAQVRGMGVSSKSRATIEFERPDYGGVFMDYNELAIQFGCESCLTWEPGRNRIVVGDLTWSITIKPRLEFRLRPSLDRPRCTVVLGCAGV